MRLKSLQNWGSATSAAMSSEREPYKVPPLGLVAEENQEPANADDQQVGLPMIVIIAFAMFVSGCIILLAAGYLHTQGRLNLPI